MTGQEDRARVRARVGAGTMVWTMREPAARRDPDWFLHDGPRSDHLAALIRRQRRRRALRRGILWVGSWVRVRRTSQAVAPALPPSLPTLPRPRVAVDENAEAVLPPGH